LHRIIIKCPALLILFMEIFFKNEMDEKLSAIISDKGGELIAIFAHGFKSNKDNLLFKSLEAHFGKNKISTLRFDFSGCGKSEGDYSDSTITKQSREINSIIKKLHHKKIILVGHSMGCSASILAAEKNKKICGLVLINPLVFPYLTFSDSLIKFSPYVLLSKFDPDKIVLDKRFERIKNTKEKLSKIFKREIMGKEMIEEFKKMDILSLAKEFKMPSMIIHGKNDELIPLSHAEYLHYNLSKSKLVVFDYFHTPFKKKEAEFIAYYASDFVKKLKEKFLK